MANTTLFNTTPGAMAPASDAVNEAGGIAYDLPAKHKLAQYAVTGCLNHTYYASAENQLATVLELARKVDPRFIAQAAIYCRRHAYMKDMPALLAAVLTTRGQEYLPAVFDAVMDSGRLVRNFVQIVRSGVVGRKSLGSAPKRLVKEWLEKRDDRALFFDSVGNKPSLADIIKMVHPKAADAARNALYAWLIGKPHDAALLPACVREYLAFGRGHAEAVIPDAPFQMLMGLELTQHQWADVALQASWQTLRMNLNTFARHGVLDIPGMDAKLAEKLASPAAIRKARVFPFQLLSAYTAAGSAMPPVIQAALEDAMEIAIENVPVIDGDVVICPDVSGSMSSPVTGYRTGATTAVRCIDAAALTAAALMRKNPRARVLPFEDRVVRVDIDPAKSVLQNAQVLASIGGGGTDCSAPLKELNREKAVPDLVVFVSDNQSWIDTQNRYFRSGTETMKQWNALHGRNPNARLACIDIQPYGTTQAKERADILNVGGFSDDVFRILADFARGELDEGHFVSRIEAMQIPGGKDMAGQAA